MYILELGSKILIGDEELLIILSKYFDLIIIGFRMRMFFGDIFYILDMVYFDDFVCWYDGVRVLIVVIMRFRDMGIFYYLSIDDVVEMFKSMEKKLEVFVMSYIGMKMYFVNFYKEVKYIENVIGVKMYVVKEGFRIIVNKKEIVVRILRLVRFV